MGKPRKNWVYHKYRWMGDGSREEWISARKAIRLKCLDCSNWQNHEVRLCPVKTCPLWPFRMGPAKTLEPAIPQPQE